MDSIPDIIGIIENRTRIIVIETVNHRKNGIKKHRLKQSCKRDALKQFSLIKPGTYRLIPFNIGVKSPVDSYLFLTRVNRRLDLLPVVKIDIGQNR